MNSWDSNDIAKAIQNKLQQIVTNCIEEYDGECDFEKNVHKTVNERMYGFIKSSSFGIGGYSDFEIKNSNFEVNSGSSGVRGKIIIEYSERKNTIKYGKPGYRGNENGEICQYPDYVDNYYKWDSLFCKWEDITDQVCDNNRNSHSNGLMNNAAFEPLWGNNRSGGDTFSSNRHKNGGDLWGTP